ncbi:hypothetical protein KP509_04G110100 [Ceratopteris richardii]|uniref:Uncharacterized protein n=1 Tax=Ceratopteris richardii TaxID=49495 RepID=A0A8T2V848_CERRI|nr:hypothetical protein KP509_04G110100 [Ceratopteris richardii]
MSQLIRSLAWPAVLVGLVAQSSSCYICANFSMLFIFSASKYYYAACELVKCLKGKCVNSSSFPFYECACDAGWKSPFKASWMPCILPNCSIDLTCANTSMEAPFSPSIPSYRSGFDGKVNVIRNWSLVMTVLALVVIWR